MPLYAERIMVGHVDVKLLAAHILNFDSSQRFCILVEVTRTHKVKAYANKENLEFCSILSEFHREL